MYSYDPEGHINVSIVLSAIINLCYLSVCDCLQMCLSD